MRYDVTLIYAGFVMASSKERFADLLEIIKQLLNSVLAGYEELLIRPRPPALADNTNLCLNNSSYPARTDFNNCLIVRKILL